MKIEVYRLLPNPLLDFQNQYMAEGQILSISDEEIIKIGKRYFELMNGPEQFGGEE